MTNKTKILALAVLILALAVSTSILLKPTAPRRSDTGSSTTKKRQLGGGEGLADAAGVKRHFDYTNRSKEPEKLTQWRREREDQLRQLRSADTEEPPPSSKFSTKSKVAIMSGDTMITGGWQTEPGKKLFTMITPTIQPDGTVMIATKLLTLTDKVGEQTLLQFKSVQFDGTTGITGIMKSGNMASLMNALEQSTGVDILSSPTLATRDSIGGQISVGTAIQLGYTPTIQSDGKTVTLDMDLKLELPSADGTKEQK